MLTIGVIADTHIPDRARKLDPGILPIFRDAGVQAILHAGDVSTPDVLDQLSQVAPVHAVRGNRDWWLLRHLPVQLELEFGGMNIGLAHGHGHWWNYLIDRVDYLVGGYRLELFAPRLLAAFPKAAVIAFGHTHRPLNQKVNGKLLFNPGSPHCPDRKDIAPSVGLLYFNAGSEVTGEILPLGF